MATDANRIRRFMALTPDVTSDPIAKDADQCAVAGEVGAVLARPASFAPIA